MIHVYTNLSMRYDYVLCGLCEDFILRKGYEFFEAFSYRPRSHAPYGLLSHILSSAVDDSALCTVHNAHSWLMRSRTMLHKMR